MSSEALPNFGLDAELAAKAAEKYDVGLEKQVTAWIVEITGESFESKGADTFAQFLNDGTVLCALVNKIMPGKIAKVNTMKAPFKKMENITKFTDAARAVGVSESAMFATPDLYEEKNLGSVVNCLYTFARVIQTAAPDFQGPKLGTGMAGDQVHDAGRGKQLATQTGGLAGTLHDEKKGTGHRERAVLPAAGGEAAAEADAQGLDADMKRKMEEKFDHGLEAEVCQWIEAVTGDSKGDQSSAEWLKSGQVLCELGNKIKPGSIKGVSKSNMPFNQMENIKKFLGMAREIGMNESSCFSTPDLFEEKNMGIVVQSLYTFGGVVQSKVPEYSGPSIGVAVKADVEDKSRGIGLITDQKDVFQATMQVERPTNTGIIRG